MLHNGYVINIENLDEDEMLEVGRESFLWECGVMESLFRNALKEDNYVPNKWHDVFLKII